MTKKDLKDKRIEIIEFINSRGYDLKFSMEMAVELCHNCSSTEELFIELEQYCKPVKKESKLASMVCNHEFENGIKYDVVKKEYVKI